jgi:hypothetical protein
MSAALDLVVASCRRNSKFVVSTIGDRQEADYWLRSRADLAHGEHRQRKYRRALQAL